MACRLRKGGTRPEIRMRYPGHGKGSRRFDRKSGSKLPHSIGSRGHRAASPDSPVDDPPLPHIL